MEKNYFYSSNRYRKKKICNYLTNCGWQEVITYSLVPQEIKGWSKESKKNQFYYLLMPKNKYHKFYRQTLIPSHLEIIKYNFSRGNRDLFFFETSLVSSIFWQEELLTLSGTGSLIDQPFHKLNFKMDFYWMKGTLENIFQLLQIKSKACFLPSKDLFFFQSAEILLEKEKIGILGEIHPQVDHKYRQINKPIFIAELSLSKLFNYLDDFSPKPVYQQISNFPTSERDLSFIFFENIDYNKVIKEIKKSSSEVLQKISILDVYQDSKMAKASQKSVCFRLTFQNFFKTLEKRELEKTIKVIIKRVEKLFSAKSRSD